MLVSFFQPDPQAYPISGGGTFPATHGQTASFFQESGVQQEFAFIPDDGSATYVINVETNSTQSLAGPTSKDAKATYAASITALVQLDSTGAVSFLPYKEGDTSTNSQAKWSSVANIAAVVPAGSTSSSASASGGAVASTAGGSSASGSSKSTSSGGASATGSAQNSGAGSVATSTFSLGLIAIGSVGFIASLL